MIIISYDRHLVRQFLHLSTSADYCEIRHILLNDLQITGYYLLQWQPSSYYFR